MNIRNTLLAATILTVPAVAILTVPGAARADTVNGVYVSAGAGVNFENSTSLDSIRVGNTSVGLGKLRERFDTGFRTSAAVGYGFGNGLRAEIEGTYFQNGLSRVGIFSNGGGISGSNFVPAATKVNGERQKYGGFFNVLYDVDLNQFGLATPITPYVGLGVGYLQAVNQNVNYSEGTQALIRSTGTDGNFAYQAIIGVAYPISAVPGLAATVDYRFSNTLDPLNYKAQYFQGNTIAATKIRESEGYNHTVMVGLRYAFNAAPPPVAVAPAPVPQQTAARTYLVFFDWDRSDLTDRARQIIAEAAQATTKVQVTRIMVSGHTDTTGTARYNQGLSVRRAQNVAAELVRLGVPQASITTQGFGFSRPLVATGPNVREPQNRRVEIVLQ
jgi:outer membrane protein OmpA-like peptidoglycan-associated protein